MKKLGLIIAVIFLTSACHTTEFHNGGKYDPVINHGTWHHGGGIFGLFEWSQPNFMQQQCPQGWRSVKVWQTFGAGFVARVVPYGIYTPWTKAIRCS